MAEKMECLDKDFIPVEHEEEILVLKAIFNEDFLSVDDENHPHTFDLIIRFHSLPKKILLIHEESTELSHLPPITLRITYRPAYPELDPPGYCLICNYLTDDQLFSLANQMDAMWQAGEVIVYTWIEFIKDYFYNLNNQLFLSSIESCRNDQRFLTNYNQIGSKRIYEQLIEFNRIQNQLEFEQTNQICPICLEEKFGTNCLKFEICGHYACLVCLNSYAKGRLSTIQQTKQINCYQCNASLFLPELRRIFSNEKLFFKYQQYLIDMIWCPRCHHSIVYIPSESLSGNHPSFIECLDCQFTFCRRCEESWHPQLQCPKEEIVQEILRNPLHKSVQLNHIELKKRLLEHGSLQMIQQCSKPCPSCHVRIEKNGGCSHMHCWLCQKHFCWLCGWSSRKYSSHSCEPIPEQTHLSLPLGIDEAVLQDAHDQEILADVIKLVQICPTRDCRQVHMKIGRKNMVVCGKCQKSFCFSCGEGVYGLFHFSQYGCKMESAD